MKKFNIYLDGSKLDCLDEEEIKEQAKAQILKEVLKLKLAEIHMLTFKLSDGSNHTWEYERVV